MKVSFGLLLIFLGLVLVAGCGGSSEPTTTGQDELDAFLADNPESAQQAPPAMEEE